MKIGIKKIFIILFLLFLSVGVKGCGRTVAVGSPLVFSDGEYFDLVAFMVDFGLLIILLSLAYIFRKKLLHYIGNNLYLFYLYAVLLIDFIVRGSLVLFFKIEEWNVALSPMFYVYMFLSDDDYIRDFPFLFFMDPVVDFLRYKSFQFMYFLTALLSALILFLVHKLCLYIKKKILLKKTKISKINI